MAQTRSQIPKFGSWDKDDIPYTVYFENFENARKGRSSTTINPNNLEENPDALEKEAVEDGNDLNYNSGEDGIHVYASPPKTLSFTGKHHDGNGRFGNTHTRTLSDQQGIGTHLVVLTDNQNGNTTNKVSSTKSYDKLSLAERKYPEYSEPRTETQQPQRRPSRFPKFGSRTENDFQYTAYVDNARKDKAGFKMNPNDPEQNQDAFWFERRLSENNGDFHLERPSKLSPVRLHQSSSSVNQHNSQIRAGYHSKHYSRQGSSVRSRTAENGTRRMNGTTDNRNSALQSGNNHSLSVQRSTECIRRSNAIPPYNAPYQRSQSVPVFARWDETDVNSGEGHTATFNKAKEERQTETSHYHPARALPVLANCPDNPKHHKQGGLFSRFKASCCLFSNRKG